MLILNRCKTFEERSFYISQAATQFWSVAILEHRIESNLFFQRGKLPNNFDKTLSADLKPSVLQVFQDEYLFDFITNQEGDERVVEGEIISNIRNAIMALGQGFSFIANQYRLELDGEEFFIDLLFFNRHLKCLVAFELKRGKFKPEYAGQLNFYLNVLDEKVRLTEENPSIGIILCPVVTLAARSLLMAPAPPSQPASPAASTPLSPSAIRAVSTGSYVPPYPIVRIRR